MAKTWKVPARSGNGGGALEVPEEGNHTAVCVALIDLGHQLRRKYQSAEEEWQPMLYLAWELVDLDGRPLVGRDFKLSLHEKSGLRHFIEQWIGKLADGADFDLISLAGRACLLNVVHETEGERTFVRIEGASPLPKVKGKVVQCEAPSHEPCALTIEEHEQVPLWLPYLYGRSLREWRGTSRERRGKAAAPAAAVEEEVGAGGSIPF